MNNINNRTRPVRLLPGLLLLLLANLGHAQSIWTAPTGGNWGDAVSWEGGVPTIANAVLITNASSKVITVDLATPLANRNARRMDLTAPAGSINTLRLADLGAAPFRLVNSFNLDVGSRLEVGNSLLELDGSEGGNFNQFAGDILLSSGGIATTTSDPLAVNGLPSLRIGRSGVGRAMVLGGELAACDELVVGDLGGASGLLTLSNGLVRVGGILNVANNPGSLGRLEVFGGSVIATNDTARIGDDGNGALSQYAGTILLGGASVGRGANSVGRLNVRGGTLLSGTVSLGRFATAQGTLEVSGGELNLGVNTLYVGREGDGAAVFSNGVAVIETVIIAGSNTASGTLQLRGGSLTLAHLIADKPAARIEFNSGTLVITQAAIIANGSAFTVGDGVQPATLQLDGGTHTFANGIIVSANAVLKGSGTLVGAITVLPGGSNQIGASPSVTLTPSTINGQFCFSFPSVAGRLYDVLAATNLVAPVWQLQATLAGSGLPLTYTNTSPVGSQVFRVSIH